MKKESHRATPPLKCPSTEIYFYLSRLVRIPYSASYLNHFPKVGIKGYIKLGSLLNHVSVR